ncbi:glycosyltransferase [Granulicella sibirica]|nr:glycosyltransferase [Granulicella sibirica]
MPDTTQPAPELVVILPARNEQESLPSCLASLVSQSEPGFELGVHWHLLVIDDASTDNTRALASQHPGVLVLEAPAVDYTRPHSGFNGKTNACWFGAQYAFEHFPPKWLLFTDADTVHAANSLSRSMREAEKHHAAMLSYSPRQIVTGFAQRTVMPLIFSELASVYPPHKVSSPTDKLAAANGQFILIDREAYTAIGGHRAVGSEILEDVALARTLKRSDRTLRFRYAPEMVSTRMYRDTPSLIEGWSKNLTLLFPSPLALIFWRILDLLLFFGLPAIALGLPFLILWQREVIGVLWIRTVFRFYNRIARAHAAFPDSVLSILGIPLFVYLLLRSYTLHKHRKQVPWKGRTYPMR